MNNVDCETKCILRFESIEEVLRANPSSQSNLLTPQELREFDCWKTPHRREAYLASRIVAKDILESSFVGRAVIQGSLEVLSKTTGQSKGKAPSVSLAGTQLPLNVSIAHTQQMLLVGVSDDTSQPFGVDLVRCAPVTAGFQRVWFGREEYEAYAKYAEEIWLRGWAVKEAAYKAVNKFIKFTPRQICALPEDEENWIVRFVDGSSSRVDSIRVNVWKASNHLLACTRTDTMSEFDVTFGSETKVSTTCEFSFV